MGSCGRQADKSLKTDSAEGTGAGSEQLTFAASEVLTGQRFWARYLPSPTVVLVPHVDDEVLGCGALLAARPDGVDLTVAYATDGARSHAVHAPGVDRNQLGTTRQREAKQALGELGIDAASALFLDLPDGELSSHRTALEDDLSSLIERKSPRSVLLPFRMDRHPDHVALHEAAIGVLEGLERDVRLVEYFVYTRWGLLQKRDIRDRIDSERLVATNIGAFIREKRAALNRYASQIEVPSEAAVRPVLTSQVIEGFMGSYEYYIPSRSVACLGEPLGGSRRIRLAHSLEPRLKMAKDVVLSLLTSSLLG